MRRILTIFMALTLSLSMAFAQGKGGALLYDQTGDMVTGYNIGFRSSDGGAAPLGTGISYSADDFTVPAGGWQIFGAKMVYNKNATYFQTIVVTIYNDNSGMPGTAEETFSLSTWEVVDLGNQQWEYTFEFDYSADLSEGTYWISAVGKGQYAIGYLQMLDDESVIGNKAKQKDISGMPLNYPNWSDKNDAGNSNGLYNNLAFALVGPPDDNDLSLKSIIEPIDGEITATQEITVAIENAGLLTQTSYEVMYQVSTTIDDVLTLVETSTETVTTSIANKEVIEYTFTKTADMSAITTFSMLARVTLTGDSNGANDVATATAQNFGEVHQIGLDREVTSCGGIFVDEGGPTGGLIPYVEDTITFYPATEGARISLDFFEWEYYYYGLDSLVFYDGPTTDAPVLFVTAYGNPDRIAHNPGYIKARNAEGAITVYHKTSGSASSDYAGWMANVACETPNAIEFMALEMTVGGPVDFLQKGVPVDVMATVTNAGADTTSRTVYLIENNVVVDTLITANLIPGVVDTLHFNWIPSVAANEVALKVLIQNDGQDTNDDNVLTETVSVFTATMLLESFEVDFTDNNQQPLPLEWISTEGLSSAYKYDYYSTHGEAVFKMVGADTVIMPMMQAGVTDVLRFDAYPAYNSSVFVLASKTMEGPWDTVGMAPRTVSGMQPFEIDMSAYAGEPYYFAFTHNSTSTSYIDYVRGANLYKFNADLMATGFAGDAYVKDGDETILDIAMVNVGVMDIMGADYTVEIKTADSVYFTVSGVDLLANEEAMMEVPVMFATTDTLELYYEIVMAGEVRVDNNMSNTIQVIVTNLYITEGETTGTLSNAISMHYVSSVSEAIYYPSDIKSYGDLQGIEFTYKYNYPEGNDTLPVKFYIASIADSLLVDTVGSNGATYFSKPNWIGTDSIDFTMVYDGMLDIKPGAGNSLYIPFDAPFAYDGSENLILLIQKDSLNVGYKYLYIDRMASEHYRYAYGYDRVKQISVDSIDAQYNYITNYQVPNVRWHFDNPGAPVFESEPVTQAFEFADYTYNVEVDFVAGANPFTIETAMLPEWLTLTVVDDTLATLNATAIDTVGVFTVQLVVSDGTFSATQTFDVRVYGVPVFTTDADTLAEAEMAYTYDMAVSYNGVGVAEFGGIIMPEWLTLTNNGDNTATLSTDSVAAKGEYNVSINAYGAGSSATQSFIITVDATPVFDAMADAVIKEATDYSATVTVDDATAAITAGDNMDAAFTVTDNADGTATVAGTALVVGEYVVDVVADNGNFSSAMSYVVTVGAVPVFTSEAVVTALRDVVYTYDVVVTYNGDDAVMLSADVPSWLTFTDNGDGTGTLTGTPTFDDGTIFTVSIIAAGEYYFTTQTFTGDIDPNAINSVDANAFNIYPNPANNFVMVTDAENATVEIRDITGKLMFTQEMISGNERIDVSEFNNGIYIISITNNNVTVSKRLVIE